MSVKTLWISIALLTFLALAGRSEAETNACSFPPEPMQSTAAPAGSETDPAVAMGPGDLQWMALDCVCCADCIAQYDACASDCGGISSCEQFCFNEARVCARSCGAGGLNGCATQC